MFIALISKPCVFVTELLPFWLNVHQNLSAIHRCYKTPIGTSPVRSYGPCKHVICYSGKIIIFIESILRKFHGLEYLSSALSLLDAVEKVLIFGSPSLKLAGEAICADMCCLIYCFVLLSSESGVKIFLVLMLNSFFEVCFTTKRI